MSEDEGRKPEYYSRTPLVKRLPTVGSLALALALATALDHGGVWIALLIFVGTFVGCVLLLHLVFHQPLERLLQYKDFDDR